VVSFLFFSNCTKVGSRGVVKKRMWVEEENVWVALLEITTRRHCAFSLAITRWRDNITLDPTDRTFVTVILVPSQEAQITNYCPSVDHEAWEWYSAFRVGRREGQMRHGPVEILCLTRHPQTA